MENLLTDANLLAGMHLWRTRKTNWPNDFHNMFYQELSRSKQNGLSADWWRQMVGYLSGWKALRPLTKEAIYLRGLDRLGQLQVTYKQIIASSTDSSLNLTTASWETLEELYSIAFDIKGLNSPVFGSKLCHFILPNAFPVIDREVIGINSRAYYDYWQFCKMQWAGCSEREALQQKLKQTIGNIVYAQYPYTTKITELCIIGSRV